MYNKIVRLYTGSIKKMFCGIILRDFLLRKKGCNEPHD